MTYIEAEAKNTICLGDHSLEFLAEIYRRLPYRTGRVALGTADSGHDIREAANYVMSGSAAEQAQAEDRLPFTLRPAVTARSGGT